jgi:hypothetical protein
MCNVLLDCNSQRYITPQCICDTQGMDYISYTDKNILRYTTLAAQKISGLKDRPIVIVTGSKKMQLLSQMTKCKYILKHVSESENKIAHKIKLKNRHKCSEIRKTMQNELQTCKLRISFYLYSKQPVVTRNLKTRKIV